MEKDKLIAEYMGLCLQYMEYAGPDPVNKEERDQVIYRIKQIRELLGMKTIDLK